jgi:hypothetical protein
MRTVITTAALLLSLVFAVPAATAAPLVSKTAGMSIELPANYTAQTKGDVLIVAQDSTGEAGLLVVVVDQANAKKALKLLGAKASSIFTNAKWGKPKATKISGLSGFEVHGAALMQGKPVDVAVLVLGPTPTGKGLLIFGAIEHGKDVHKAEIGAILQSLKPAS